ncbi:Phosphofructokinase [Artemisia annua]|uniref:Phosphofructokinase n=1 Tax=Artemisia annua TaxID=35608 RepID=A0A2U1MB50_ARTAN|nr:Phosphofructokinase [Artemisia annua]
MGSYGQPSASLKAAGSLHEASLKTGVVLSGRQAPDGEKKNIDNFLISLLLFVLFFGWNTKYLQKMTEDSSMYGFRGGLGGVMKGKYVKLTDEIFYRYRNQVCFDMICSGSGRDKKETPEQFKEAQETVTKLRFRWTCGHCHNIHVAVKAFGKRPALQEEGLLTSFLGGGCECEGYTLRVVGHSLG